MGAQIGGRCAVCGMPGHRYGTTDPKHKFDGVACVNGLLPQIGALRDALGTVCAEYGVICEFDSDGMPSLTLRPS